MILADEKRHDPIGLRLLNPSDDGAELRNRQRDELLADDLAADERREGPCPSSGELAEIIVGSDRVAAWPELLDHVLDARNDLLLAHRAGTERVGIGNATLVLVRIKIKLLGLIDDRSNRLALSAGETSNQHVDLVLLYEPSRQLLPECVVALTVRREELGFAAQDALLAGVDQDVRILGKNHIA